MTRVVGCLVSTAVLVMPACVRAQAPATDRAAAVDTARLMADVRVLAADSMEGRGVGSAGSVKARAYLLGRFTEVGLRPIGDSFERPFTFTGGGASGRGVNLVGVIEGVAQPGQYIVVTAHYDHLGVRDGAVHNGADDNASGTAALIEIARELSETPPAHSVIIAALDAEESGLRGARAFVDDPPVEANRILANLNLDMVSRGDGGELWVAGTYHYPNLLPLVEEVAARSPVDLRVGHDRPGVAGQDDWTNASDHGPFHAAGIPFLYTGVEDHADYHKPTDDADRIDPGFYGRAVATITDLLRELDAFLSS